MNFGTLRKSSSMWLLYAGVLPIPVEMNAVQPALQHNRERADAPGISRKIPVARVSRRRRLHRLQDEELARMGTRHHFGGDQRHV